MILSFVLEHAAQRCAKWCLSSLVCGVSANSDVTVSLLLVLEDSLRVFEAV